MQFSQFDLEVSLNLREVKLNRQYYFCGSLNGENGDGLGGVAGT